MGVFYQNPHPLHCLSHTLSYLLWVTTPVFLRAASKRNRISKSLTMTATSRRVSPWSALAFYYYSPSIPDCLLLWRLLKRDGGLLQEEVRSGRHTRQHQSLYSRSLFGFTQFQFQVVSRGVDSMTGSSPVTFWILLNVIWYTAIIYGRLPGFVEVMIL